MMAQQLKQHLYMSAGAVATVSESSARLGFGTESSAAVRLYICDDDTVAWPLVT